MIIRLAVSYPPSSNNNTLVARGRRISSPKYRAWTKAAVDDVCQQLGRPVATMLRKGKTVADPERAEITGPYRIKYVVQRPDRRRRDVENCAKSIADSLQAAGVIADDCNCEHSTSEWAPGGPVGKGALVLVEITPA